MYLAYSIFQILVGGRLRELGLFGIKAQLDWHS